MRTTSQIVTDFEIDSNNYIWVSGKDINVYNGNNWITYNYQNSILPSDNPYYLDSRAIAVSDRFVWVGLAGFDPLMIKIEKDNPKSGILYSISDFGLTGINYEIDIIKYDRYTENLLVVINGLNDDIGNSLLYLIKNTGEIVSILPEPIYRIRQIKIRGIENSVQYWICTDNGLLCVESFDITNTEILSSGTEIPYYKKYYTSQNSGLISNIVLDVDFDEKNNLWVSSDAGLQYFDDLEENWYTWNTDTNPEILGDYVRSLSVRENGHIFFTTATGITGDSNGVFHFNGSNFQRIDSGNSSLPENSVIKITVAEKRWDEINYSQLPLDIWVMTYSGLTKLSYQIPRIVATSKFPGASGWQFVDLITSGQTSGILSSSFPRNDSYTWTTPHWSDYPINEITKSFPGTNPKSLFLNVPLEDQTSGEALDPSYWLNSSLPTFEQISEGKNIGDLYNSFSITGATSGDRMEITKILDNNDRVTVVGNFDSPSIWISSITGSIQIFNNTQSLTGYTGSSGYRSTGFLATWTKNGNLENWMTINSHESYISDAVIKKDSIYLTGVFSGYIMLDQFIWSSQLMGAYTSGGPTGSQIGFSNSSVFASGPYNYPWIYNGTTSMAPGPYVKDIGLIDQYSNSGFVIEISNYIGNSLDWSGLGTTGYNKKADSSIFLKSFNFLPALSRYEINKDPAYGWSTINPESLKIDSTSDDGVVLGLSYKGGVSLSSGELVDIEEDLGTDWKKNQAGFTGYGTTYVKYNDSYRINWSNDFISNNESLNIYTQSDPNTLNFNIGLTFSGQSFFETDPVTGPSGSLYMSRIDGVGNKVWGATACSTNNSEIKWIIGEEELGGFDLSLPGSGIVEIFGERVNTGSSGEFYLSKHLYNRSKSWSFVYGVTGSAVSIDDLATYDNSIYVTGSFGASGYYISKFGDNGEINQTIILNSGSKTIDNIKINGVPVILTEGTENGRRRIDVDYYKKYVFIPGKSLGNIDSLVGSSPWSKFDLHSSSTNETSMTLSDFVSGMEVPIMCHVIASPYGSMVPGQNSWRWTLKNYADQIIIRVLDSPYFSYTFDKEGSYGIQLELLDANGNAVSKVDAGFIKVKDHRKSSDGLSLNLNINSFNYGYIQISSPNEITQLGIQMDEEQKIILDNLLGSSSKVYYLITQEGQFLTTESGVYIEI
jgi:hypothetical protein